MLCASYDLVSEMYITSTLFYLWEVSSQVLPTFKKRGIMLHLLKRGVSNNLWPYLKTTTDSLCVIVTVMSDSATLWTWLIATLWDPCSPLGSSVQGILQARILKWNEILPFPPPEDLPNPRIQPTPLCLQHWQADSLPLGHLNFFC